MEIVLFTLLGLAIGSFLNVVILRVPENQSISFPSSHCPKCKTKLKFYHNIPVISWIALRGKCAFCHEKISFQYPLVELITAMIFIIAYLKYENITQGLILGLLFALLLALSVIDLRYKAVPDILSFPALFVAFFARSIPESFYDALLFAGGFSLLRMIISWIIKKEAMGEADIIIAGVIGGVLGVQLGLGAIYIAAVIALPAFLLVGKKGFQLPFIPFLTLGLYITWVFDTQIAALMGKIYG
ncbi:prepilin peptidase [Sulfurospirillum sp. 1612]|uniref:prepilin peptidase n=1 Tax=Sulfurospirillum sp. 1612 TaxID=3094835 RepID=UPI002F959548